MNCPFSRLQIQWISESVILTECDRYIIQQITYTHPPPCRSVPRLNLRMASSNGIKPSPVRVKVAGMSMLPTLGDTFDMRHLTIA